MTLSVDTRHQLGGIAYFLNANHEITKGVIKRIDSHIIAYKDNYTEVLKTYEIVKYDISVADDYIVTVDEDNLYSTPDEILAMFNDQVQELIN